MRTLCLLLIAGFVTLSATAQSLLPTNSSRGIMGIKPEPARINASAMKHNGHRTTSGMSGWYGYKAYMDTITASGSVVSTDVGLLAPYMWNDTGAFVLGGYNTLASYAYIYDPTFSGFSTYLGLPTVTAADPYTVDSLTLYGKYCTNPAKTGVVDTLKIGYVYGSFVATGDDIYRSDLDISFAPASILTGYGLSGTATDSLWYPFCKYDSADNVGTGATYHEQILTISTAPSSNTNINWGDTLSDGTMYHPFAFDVPAAVPAGNLLAITVSFKSGDPSFVFGDTVVSATAGYKYNIFCAYVAYYSDSIGASQFWDYNPADKNTGLYKTLPNYENGWIDVYIPMWAWVQGSDAPVLQYPLMDVHAIGGSITTAVANTGNLKHAQVVPNPADNSTAIYFGTNGAANVTISLTDATGMVVAAKQMENVTDGKVSLSTANLASGVYFYTLVVDGKRSAGRVVVSH